MQTKGRSRRRREIGEQHSNERYTCTWIIWDWENYDDTVSSRGKGVDHEYFGVVAKGSCWG